MANKMIKKISIFWNKTKIHISKYLMLYLILLGLVCFFIGRALIHYHVNDTISELFVSVGKIILGAGFFTGLTKSNHYSKFFQDRIFNVLYNPGDHFSDYEIKSKWLSLTNYLLTKKVRKHHSTASQIIFDRFLDPEHGYYYRNMVIDYEITLNADNVTLTITQNMCLEIVFNDDETEIELKQHIVTNGSMTLMQLIIDDEKIDHTANCTVDPKNPNTQIFLKKIQNKDNSPVKVERSYKIVQNILDEPYVISNYSKFIKGISVRYIAKNCKVTVKQTGIINNPQATPNVIAEENGYTRVVLATKDELTLPGQGFILIVSNDTFRRDVV